MRYRKTLSTEINCSGNKVLSGMSCKSVTSWVLQIGCVCIGMRAFVRRRFIRVSEKSGSVRSRETKHAGLRACYLLHNCDVDAFGATSNLEKSFLLCHIIFTSNHLKSKAVLTRHSLLLSGSNRMEKSKALVHLMGSNYAWRQAIETLLSQKNYFTLLP